MGALLPSELIDSILTHLTDPADLSACSLVNHTFLIYAQSRLYRCVRLTLAHITTRPTQILERRLACLEAYPHIGAYIRDLSVDVLPLDSPAPQEIMAALLSAILRHGTLERLAVDLHQHSYDKLHPSLRKALEGVRVSRLHLFRGNGLPRSFIAVITQSVRVLSLSHVTGMPTRDSFPDPLPPVELTNSSALEELILPRSLAAFATLRWYPFLFTAPLLHRLYVPYSLWHALCGAGDTEPLLARLRTLSLDCGSVGPGDLLEMPRLPQLTDLTLIFMRDIQSSAQAAGDHGIQGGGNSEGTYTIPANLVALLSVLPAPILERLTLHVMIPTPQGTRNLRPEWATGTRIRVSRHPNADSNMRPVDIDCVLGHVDPFVVCPADAAPDTYFGWNWAGFVRFMQTSLGIPASGSEEAGAMGRVTFATAQANSRVNYMDHLR
ncbi:Membrane transporter [Mycena chlorophos]|uniref:Membrane transporter n=1 Tax=Mycena chlorophos TaxID=658473 RepID=A0A8H6SK70_MYCCL|nr:Membrane transporter [Mycena chlorophos]